jgi:predicted enzyme related to lactoylglutathione lyase
MSLRLGSTVVNVADIESMTDFWSAALHLTPSRRDPDDNFRVLRGEYVNLSLQLADTPVSSRDQMHFDLYADDEEAEAGRLEGLGAVRVRKCEDPEDTFVVMRDPEDNEFCVCRMAPKA